MYAANMQNTLVQQNEQKGPLGVHSLLDPVIHYTMIRAKGPALVLFWIKF